MKLMRLLLVEDDVRLSQALVEAFQKNRYGVDAVYTGPDGLKYAQGGIYDAVILDVMLPGMDGISILKTLREEKNAVPVLLLSDKHELQDIVSGLDSGADDFIPKPFEQEELLARVRAATRRKGAFKENAITFGDLTLDKNRCELQRTGGGSVKRNLFAKRRAAAEDGKRLRTDRRCCQKCLRTSCKISRTVLL